MDIGHQIEAYLIQDLNLGGKVISFSTKMIAGGMVCYIIMKDEDDNSIVQSIIENSSFKSKFGFSGIQYLIDSPKLKKNIDIKEIG